MALQPLYRANHANSEVSGQIPLTYLQETTTTKGFQVFIKLTSEKNNKEIQ